MCRCGSFLSLLILFFSHFSAHTHKTRAQYHFSLLCMGIFHKNVFSRLSDAVAVKICTIAIYSKSVDRLMDSSVPNERTWLNTAYNAQHQVDEFDWKKIETYTRKVCPVLKTSPYLPHDFIPACNLWSVICTSGPLYNWRKIYF